MQWIVLRNPIYVYGDDYRALHALIGDNFRPVQPFNGRVVRKGARIGSDFITIDPDRYHWESKYGLSRQDRDVVQVWE